MMDKALINTFYLEWLLKPWVVNFSKVFYKKDVTLLLKIQNALAAPMHDYVVQWLNSAIQVIHKSLLSGYIQFSNG